MNSKSAFHQAPNRRVVATAGLQALQGEEQGCEEQGDCQRGQGNQDWEREGEGKA